jgi:glycine/D-amino acid oxidase-like deaminating enzyme
MQIDHLIIGQGLSGTWLSFYLQQMGRKLVVIDSGNQHSPSAVSGGLINPVTGRRLATTWMAEQVLPFAEVAYAELSKFCGSALLTKTSIIDFFPSPDIRISFQKREPVNEYLEKLDDENSYSHIFNYEFGCGKIRPAYIVHAKKLLGSWRHKLKNENALLEEVFEPSELEIISKGIKYKDIKASSVIFCDGPSNSSSRWFGMLPYAYNKGECLLLEIEDLSPDHIYKRSSMLVPTMEKNIYWYGSSYEWDYTNDQPGSAYRQSAENALRQFLKIPFRILDHYAAIRPATLERRPFVGAHPLFPSLYLLNGMGTKGCSLAPFFAHELAEHICYMKTLTPESNLSRYTKILSGKFS